ncbi:MAG: hypothetical protein K9L28_06890 [Synergistales bacterium]|nr:hypothetical protein [Synergistales bacterium]
MFGEYRWRIPDLQNFGRLALVVVVLLGLAATPCMASDSYSFVTEWGKLGVADGQFSVPAGIATDEAGHVYVVDSGNYRIQKFDSSGNFITKWGTSGSGNGQFSGPMGIAVEDGYVYVADSGNDRIQKFDTSGNFITAWGSQGIGDGQFKVAADVEVHGGFVYVNDIGGFRIQKFDTSGNFITKWDIRLDDTETNFLPYGMAVDGMGNIYVMVLGNAININAPEFRIMKYTGSGTQLGRWVFSSASMETLGLPMYGMEADDNGYLYAISMYSSERGAYQGVLKIDPSGNVVTRIKCSDLDMRDFRMYMYHDVTVDGAGNIYVTEGFGKHCVEKYGNGGEVVTPAPTAVPSAAPTPAPTAVPTAAPTGSPTAAPTESPSDDGSGTSDDDSDNVFSGCSIGLSLLAPLLFLPALLLLRR